MGLEISSALVDHFVQVETVRRGEDSAADEEVELRAAGRGSVIRRFREGLSLEPQFLEEMASLGYTDREAQRYLVIARLEFDTNWRLDLVQAALTSFRRGRIDLEALGARLVALGITEDLRDAYLEREVARIRVEDPDADEVELRATGRGVVSRRYREGWISAGPFAQEMASLGYTEREIALYQLIADLEFDYDWKQDILATRRTQFQEDVIDPLRFTADLAELGMAPGRIQTHLAREIARKGPPEAPGEAA